MEPVPQTKLKMKMVEKGLSLRYVSNASGVGYSLCSLILNGRYNDPDKLAKIKRVIRNAPMPTEAATA
jgi:hypothetical protein